MTSTSELAAGIYLHTTKTEDPITYTYEVECTVFKAVKLVLDFGGSRNMALKDSNKLKSSANLRPYSRLTVASVYIVDKTKAASLSLSQSWTVSSPSLEDTCTYIRAHTLKMKPLLHDAHTFPFPAAELDPTNTAMNEVCQSYGKKFIDKDFPPTLSSLFKSTTQLTDGELSGTGATERTTIEWRRPTDFMVGEYQVFEAGIEPGDIQQGQLGDCWFLCAIAALTEFPQLVKDLFEAHEVSEHGVYRVRFCKNGWWQSVRLDDYFPCKPAAGPIYSRCNGNELWVMLLEKAYSKLHGSYESIRAGKPYEAMMDMTGAPCKTITFSDADVAAKIENGELWREILFYDTVNYIMTASTKGEDIFTELGGKPGKETMGLVPGHAYTLIAAKQSSSGHRLLKLRNPWGETEWTGAWCDDCPLWTDQMQTEIEHLVKGDDGIFWMSYEDFIKYFRAVNVCMVRHQDYHPVPWVEKRSRFVYHYNSAEGVLDSHRVEVPIYTITLTEPGTFVMAVHQEDERCTGARAYIDVGVSILRHNEETGNYELIVGTELATERQVGTDELNLEAGKYVIVPTTTGIKIRESLANVTPSTSIPTEAAAPVPLVHTAPSGRSEFTDATVRALSEIFDRLDHDNDGYLHRAEVEQYLQRCAGNETGLHGSVVVKVLLQRFSKREGAGLSKHAFLQAQQVLFQQTGADECMLRAELRIFGYDDRLQLQTTGRAAVLSMHGSVQYTLSSAPFDAAVYEAATTLPVKVHGECKVYDNGRVRLYSRVFNHEGVSFVVENVHTKPLEYTLDCTTCRRVSTHRAAGFKHSEVILPGEAKVMHHLICDGSGKSWSWGYSSSYLFKNKRVL